MNCRTNVKTTTLVRNLKLIFLSMTSNSANNFLWEQCSAKAPRWLPRVPGHHQVIWDCCQSRHVQIIEHLCDTQRGTHLFVSSIFLRTRKGKPLMPPDTVLNLGLLIMQSLIAESSNTRQKSEALQKASLAFLTINYFVFSFYSEERLNLLSWWKKWASMHSLSLRWHSMKSMIKKNTWRKHMSSQNEIFLKNTIVADQKTQV